MKPEQLSMIAKPAAFCPSPQCDVVYFDSFERVVVTHDLDRAVYPKDPTAPICACFGLTADAIEQDVDEGVTTRTKAALEKAKSSAAKCTEMAANGRPCVAYIQKYYLERLKRKAEPRP